MSFDATRLMNLLPAVYRARDDRKNELRALFAVIAEQIGVLEEDLVQLYDDQFIETCAAWVIPYIGDLLGNRPLYDGGGDADEEPRELFPDLSGPRFVPRVALRARADVAKTIFYRKRKATLPMLEALASDVTGWTARVVEFFELLRWNQCVRNHLRLFSLGQPDLRRNEPLERINGPFDTVSHTVDVRPIGQLDGWYETRNIGFFLWRLRSYALDDADACLVNSTFGFTANRLGLDAPLFTRAKRNDFVGVTELQVPGPIRPTFFLEDLRRYNALPTPRPNASDIYGLPDEPLPDLARSLVIFVNGTFVTPDLICAANLATWNQPAGSKVAVDVRNGRIALGLGYPKGSKVTVSFHYGFSADLGGGTYPRSGWLVKHNADDPNDQIVVKKGTTIDTIAKALAKWAAGGRKNTVITIGDNHTYDEPGTLTLDPPAKKRIVIQADDLCWPHIRLQNPMRIACGDDAAATLSGLLVEGRLVVRRLAGRLRLLHTTVVSAPPSTSPQPSLSVPPAVVNATNIDTFRAEIAFSILVGAIQLPPNGRGLTIVDSIVDGAAGGDAITGYKKKDPGPALRIERSTVFGRTFVRELPLATEVIFTDTVIVVRRQQGCARFSFLPRDSRTPRPYRCQPDLEIREQEELEAARLHIDVRDLTPAQLAAIADGVHEYLAPSFTSIRYGDPGYAQLHLRAPRQIALGAQDGSEMGAFCHLKQPQREGNLRLRLGEYLPFGLVPGFIYVT